MSVPAPHFHLYSEARVPAPAAAFAASAVDRDCAANARSLGQWRFILRKPGGETSFEATDQEEGATEERLELLAVVRGLEALDQPSRVTLVTARRNLKYGLEGGLAEWRNSDWQWERFGKMTPVKNRDLWQRLDRLLEIHTVDCRPRGKTASDLAPPLPAGDVPRSLTTRSRRSGRILRLDPPPPGSRRAARRNRAPGGWLWRPLGSLAGRLRSWCSVGR